MYTWMLYSGIICVLFIRKIHTHKLKLLSTINIQVEGIYEEKCRELIVTYIYMYICYI